LGLLGEDERLHVDGDGPIVHLDKDIWFTGRAFEALSGISSMGVR
jgi:hypothetical protein